MKEKMFSIIKQYTYTHVPYINHEHTSYVYTMCAYIHTRTIRSHTRVTLIHTRQARANTRVRARARKSAR